MRSGRRILCFGRIRGSTGVWVYHRVIAYLDWKAKWWREQGDAHLGELEADIADGVSAYAAKQAHIYTSMARSFAATWYHVLLANGLPIEWPRLYTQLFPLLLIVILIQIESSLFT